MCFITWRSISMRAGPAFLQFDWSKAGLSMDLPVLVYSHTKTSFRFLSRQGKYREAFYVVTDLLLQATQREPYRALVLSRLHLSSCWFHGSSFKGVLLFFLLPDWLKLNHLKSQMECGFSDIFSCHFCSTVAETIGLTNYAASVWREKMFRKPHLKLLR